MLLHPFLLVSESDVTLKQSPGLLNPSYDDWKSTTERLWVRSEHRRCLVFPFSLRNTLTHKPFYTETLLHKSFTHKHFYTDALVHTQTLLQTSFHRNTPTHKHVYTQTLLTHRSLYTQTCLNRCNFTCNHFYTQTSLHSNTRTHTHTRLHTKTFTHRRFYTQHFYTDALAHTNTFTHKHLYTEARTCESLVRGCTVYWTTLNLLEHL